LLRLSNIQVAPEGLLLIVNGNPQLNVQRVESPDRLIVDLQSTSVPRQLHGVSIPLNRFGIRQIRVAQFQKSPSVARIVLDFDPNDPNSKLNWQTVFNPSRGGLLIVPVGKQVTQPGVPPTAPNSPIVINNSPVTNPGLTLIQGLSFTNSGQLLIQANRDISYRGSIDLPSRTFNITISSAQISPQIQRPSLPSSSPVERLRLTQVGSSVLVGIKVSPGWQLREVPDGNKTQIALQLSGSSWGTVGQVPPLTPPLPVPSPSTSPYPSPISPRPNSYPSRSVNPNRGRGVVVVDPGHGGPDVGTIGNGIYEKNVTLPISLRLGRILQQMGYSVVYTRTEDIDLDLEPRVSLAERVNAEVFVSIHANSLESRSSEISGVETYHARGSAISTQLAQMVHDQVIAGTGALDRGVRGAGFYVIKRTSMPAILVETGFVTNAREAANLNNPAYQDRMAASIARGVDRFIKSYR
jgi:N-acetylmuramoyl-L-alanine amidase